MKNLESCFSFNRPDSNQEEDSPIKPGEVFDASKELLEIKKSHGAEGLEQLALFKEKLKYQKEGLAMIEDKLMDYLHNNSDFSLPDIRDLIASDLDKYGFGQDFRESMLDFSKNLFNRSKNIKKVVSECLDEGGNLDNAKLFERLFFRPPLGDLKVEVDNISIYVRLNNDDDFAYIARGAYKKKRAINDVDREVAQSTGGLALSDYPSAKLRGLILVECPDYYENENVHQETKLHEQQHAFNFLLKKFEFSDYELGLKKLTAFNESNDEELDEDEKGNNSIMFLINNPRIEAAIKDEITAYLKGRTDTKEISNALLSPDTIYDFGSGYNLPDITDSDGSLSYKYMKLVEQGLIAFAKLQEEGYPYEAVHAVLFSEPLAFWLKAAQRIDGEKISPEKFKELEEKYIAPHILENMINTKKSEMDEVIDTSEEA